MNIDALTDHQRLADLIRDNIRTVPDFPRPGIAFLDLCPVFSQPALLGALAGAMSDAFAGAFDRVLAIEARGFVVGTAVACHAGRPLVLARKSGKLPGPVDSVRYDLEYGSAELQVQRDVLRPGERVIVVDDVLATGGTMAAADELVRRSGAAVAGYAVVVTIPGLGGEGRLGPAKVFSVLPTGN
ncbi:adenine phosphoribosyltransferase [Actinoallomurus iriomotensis]|uniref:Adenine phosphoribosyltransferase n=1 Tax=Actinoallomurus iriomotensis TaxID=478107 RepID=A0A9W6RZH1_9ACTN|nr:adenine phosphoribosyltransferase [Actinoallomurus iriomotensis]GLY84359.1 adenine phosphoribosyltransferase [Actinoallomurus iriomotensis]